MPSAAHSYLFCTCCLFVFLHGWEEAGLEGRWASPLCTHCTPLSSCTLLPLCASALCAGKACLLRLPAPLLHFIFPPPPHTSLHTHLPPLPATTAMPSCTPASCCRCLAACLQHSFACLPPASYLCSFASSAALHASHLISFLTSSASLLLLGEGQCLLCHALHTSSLPAVSCCRGGEERRRRAWWDCASPHLCLPLPSLYHLPSSTHIPLYLTIMEKAWRTVGWCSVEGRGRLEVREETYLLLLPLSALRPLLLPLPLIIITLSSSLLSSVLFFTSFH